jgi:primosomal protein N' (replication factor Y) (superfamily II helicase)
VPRIAKVVFQSVLPQLDRQFDYEVPPGLEIAVGQRVLVPFGSSKKPTVGYVVALAKESSYAGKLSLVIDLVQPEIVISEKLMGTLQLIADRSACSLGEVLKLAVPAHMPRAHLEFLKTGTTVASINLSAVQLVSPPDSTKRRVLLTGLPRFIQRDPLRHRPGWVQLVVEVARKNLALSKSTIVLVPDFREHDLVLIALKEEGLSDYLADYSGKNPKSIQYKAFLRSLNKTPSIVVGTRNAVFAPCANLETILMFDDGDPSYQDQGSPFLHTRDLALMRAAEEDLQLIFTSNSISVDTWRMVNLGYFSQFDYGAPKPKVSFSDGSTNIDSRAHGTIKRNLANGPVLIQVANKGVTRGMFCLKCQARAKCSNCTGFIIVDSSTRYICGVCNGFQLNLVCECGSTSFRQGRPGSTRTVSELGKMFPGVKVIESIGESVVATVDSKPCLVVATPGAEPEPHSGYSAVVILDADLTLGQQRLRSSEDAVRNWSNAICKLATNGEALIAGLSGELGTRISLWNQIAIVDSELNSRRELKLPPETRLASVTSELIILTALKELLSARSDLVVFGPSKPTQDNQSRLVFSYPHNQTAEIGKLLKFETRKLAAGKSSIANTGRKKRPVLINMNDPEVF